MACIALESTHYGGQRSSGSGIGQPLLQQHGLQVFLPQCHVTWLDHEELSGRPEDGLNVVARNTGLPV